MCWEETTWPTETEQRDTRHRDDSLFVSRGGVRDFYSEDGNRLVRDESCLLCGATAFTDGRKWASGSTRSTRTSARQLYPLDSVSPSAGKVKKRRQPSTRHICDLVKEKWTDFGVDLVLADLVWPTLEGLILACFDDAEGIVDCVDARTDGRRILEVKDTFKVRTRESEHYIAQLYSSSAIGEKLKGSSATVCPTEADSKYLVETASVFAGSLGGDSMPVLSAWMTRSATWSMSKFQVKSESRTALLRVLENHRIQDKIESATEVASELRHTEWIADRRKRVGVCEAQQDTRDRRRRRAPSLCGLEDAGRRVEVERQSEGTLSKEVRSSKCAVRQDPANFLANGGAKEKGTAALRKETLQLKESKKASKDKDAPKRPAGGVYGQLLAEKREEIKKSLSADHKITDVTKRAGERWKSLPADETQKRWTP